MLDNGRRGEDDVLTGHMTSLSSTGYSLELKSSFLPDESLNPNEVQI